MELHILPHLMPPNNLPTQRHHHMFLSHLQCMPLHLLIALPLHLLLTKDKILRKRVINL